MQDVGGKRPKDLTGYKSCELNIYFYTSTKAWPVCEVQKAFMIDNRLTINAISMPLRAIMLGWTETVQGAGCVTIKVIKQRLSATDPDLLQSHFDLDPHSKYSSFVFMKDYR